MEPKHPARPTRLDIAADHLGQSVAHVEDRRFHIGIGVPVDFLQASFHKIVDNTSANTLVPGPRDAVWCFRIRIPPMPLHLGMGFSPAIAYLFPISAKVCGLCHFLNGT